ncbi:Acetyltransferase (GNAT) domain-containing protein [Faunimonas pinastri]|uniref:Acetyltransferase (GNAT) domain-containing protein n=1 Tax=Faunimonas pinastri TaxID=1855383 RepID=A0A1H9CW76_9HYPH|nr:GNAT family N-acetyltransferase [Faunimonas pinastri]SEQ05424.1 Acetyltransferase (GNAT) domain-containing protein [Faunimonas pinastri]
MAMEQRLHFSDALSEDDLRQAWTWIAGSYWAKDLDWERFRRAAEHSVVIGAFVGDRLVGFARVMTDYSRSARLSDVYVAETARGGGVAAGLVACALDHPKLRDVPSWTLATRDAHGLYERFGFRTLDDPSYTMQLNR